MSGKIAKFQEEHPSLESYWRSIILFGNNVASYKFALAKTLLEIAPAGKPAVHLEELAAPYAKHLCEHLRQAGNERQQQIFTGVYGLQCGKGDTGAVAGSDGEVGVQ